MTQRILVVDDDCEMVGLLCAYLEQSGYQVLVAHDGEAALQILRREQPDLVLLDLMLPERDDLGNTGEVRGNVGMAAMPIIMLNAHVKADDDSAGLEQGSDGSATQPPSFRELVAGVRAVLDRAQEEPAPPRVIQAGNLIIDLDRRQAQVGDQPVHLTPTELGLLQALAERPGHTLTRLEMIERGLGYSYEGVGRTVDSHVKNLRRKLDEAGEAAYLVETVFGVGYRLATGDNA